MAFCTRCGKQIEDGAICGCSASRSPQVTITIDREAIQRGVTSVKETIGFAEKDEIGTYERGCQIVPDNIEPSEGEIPVKQYKVAILRTLMFLIFPRMRAEGRMQVTNKRVIFRAPGRDIVGGKTVLQHEYAIDDIAGIEAQTNYKFRVQYLIVGILTLGLAPLIASRVKLWVKLVAAGCLLISAYIIVSWGLDDFGPAIPFLSAYIILSFACFLRFCYRPNLVIKIKNKMGVEDSPVDVSIKGTLFLEVMPTDESEKAIRELGAMISDIQKLGDLGLQKWLNK